MTVPSAADCRFLTDLEAQAITGGVAKPSALYPVGTGGQSGCALMQNHQWAAERRAQRDAQAQIP